MPFKKGESGNPGGKRNASATFRVRQLAQEYTEEAIKRLAFWMRADDPKASVQAANLLLERGWGKPTAAVDEEILRAKLELLKQGHDHDATSVTVIIPDYADDKKGE